MSIPKDLFLIDIGPEVIDLSSINESEWHQIKLTTKKLINEGQVKEVSRAYIAAFIMWLDVQRYMRQEYDSRYDIMN
jgi:hypothetical protein